MPEYPLTREIAVAYFERHRDEVCGWSGESESCPLACALNEHYHVSASVGVGTYDIVNFKDEDWRFSTPAWAATFVDRVDERDDDLTGAECLAILAEIGEG
jgi:hypothetical protein